jgi:3',5'-cyclic AMP phosphodiesterase CpdA
MTFRSIRYLNLSVALLALACAMPAQSTTQQTTPPRTTAPVATQPGPATTAPPPAPAVAGDTLAPTAQNSVKFAVIGDSGQPGSGQTAIAKQMVAWRTRFPYEFVIMMGDNLYGSERPQDFVRKFETPYKPLLDANVTFHASLGNHDDPNQRFYKFFNMNGERYYTFKKQSVRFFALDSNYMDRDQLAWLKKELEASGSDWKIPFFHHPLYSSGGTHGSEVDLRTQVEPLFLQYGVSVVFAGHEHFYERVKPQRGIQYFTNGGGAKLRTGDIRKTNLTAVGYDSDNTYMLAEIAGDVMTFQTLNRQGKRIDGGTVAKVSANLSQ